MTEEELREKIAELEHKQWAHWFIYQLNNSTPENVDRWIQQVNTPYRKLSKNEKDADRKWADQILTLIREAGYLSPEEIAKEMNLQNEELTSYYEEKYKGYKSPEDLLNENWVQVKNIAKRIRIQEKD